MTVQSLTDDSALKKEYLQATNYVQKNFVAKLAGLTYLGEGGKVEALLDYYLDDLLRLEEQYTEDVTGLHKDMNFILE